MMHSLTDSAEKQAPAEALTRRLQHARQQAAFVHAMEASIDKALQEDIGTGDVTAEAIFPAAQNATACLLAKQSGTLAGLPIFTHVFHRLNPAIEVQMLTSDGQAVQTGDTLARLHGPVLDLLKGERVALNLLQRASGIASLTQRFVAAAESSGNDKLRVLDTRKTAPGLRWLDKYAVLAGGGENHRFGLYDMALVKENHIRAAGGLSAAVQRVRNHQQRQGLAVPIEVEVTTLEELREALALKPDRILLDNMDDATLARSVAITSQAVPLEASGNVTLERMPALAKTGVDCVSIGALTHSVHALDVSLLIETHPRD